LSSLPAELAPRSNYMGCILTRRRCQIYPCHRLQHYVRSTSSMHRRQKWIKGRVRARSSGEDAKQSYARRENRVESHEFPRYATSLQDRGWHPRLAIRLLTADFPETQTFPTLGISLTRSRSFATIALEIPDADEGEPTYERSPLEFEFNAKGIDQGSMKIKDGEAGRGLSPVSGRRRRRKGETSSSSVFAAANRTVPGRLACQSRSSPFASLAHVAPT